MEIVSDQIVRLHAEMVTVSGVLFNASAKLKTESHLLIGLEMRHTVKVSLWYIYYVDINQSNNQSINQLVSQSVSQL